MTSTSSTRCRPSSRSTPATRRRRRSTASTSPASCPYRWVRRAARSTGVPATTTAASTYRRPPPLELTYQVELIAPAAANVALTNSVWIDWTSLDDGNAYERTGAGCPERSPRRTTTATARRPRTAHPCRSVRRRADQGDHAAECRDRRSNSPTALRYRRRRTWRRCTTSASSMTSAHPLPT